MARQDPNASDDITAKGDFFGKCGPERKQNPKEAFGESVREQIQDIPLRYNAGSGNRGFEKRNERPGTRKKNQSGSDVRPIEVAFFEADPCH